MTEWRAPETFDFRGQTIRWGKLGSGPPLVLLHGTPFWSHEWHRVAPFFADGFTVFFHDMLGYGGSEKRDGQNVSLNVQNEVLAGLFEHWGVDCPHVVAHDFGGATALRAHLINRLDYAALTLIDVVAIRPWGSPLVQHVKEHEASFAGMPAYMHDAILPAYIQTAMHRQATMEVLSPYMAPWQGEQNQKAFYRQIAQMDQKYTDEVQDGYGAIRCPVQILWGEQDTWIPISTGRELAGMIPDAAFHAVAASGHLMQEDAPEAIAALVPPFLERYGSR